MELKSTETKYYCCVNVVGLPRIEASFDNENEAWNWLKDTVRVFCQANMEVTSTGWGKGPR